eukprot:239759_1
MSQEMDDTEDDIEFDENDNKIIQLYEIINELIDEQKSRVDDMELLYRDQGDLVLQNVEHRNNSVLNQIFIELQLKENNDEDEDDSDSDDDSEDEQDQGWEIYNTVVTNLNGYMASIALFSQKLKEHKDMIEHMEVPQEMQEEEVKELESVVEAQTVALEAQMKRNEDLETALSSVLNEYSNRINSGNKEISSLHQQLSHTNKQHAKQVQELRAMYESKIADLQSIHDNNYKEEVSKLIESLSSSRSDFQKQIVALTQEMSISADVHREEMLTLTKHIQTLTEEKQRLVKELQNRPHDKKPKARLKKARTRLDIDDEEEFFYTKYNANTTALTIDPNKDANLYNGLGKKNRTFTPSGYTGAHQPQTQVVNRGFTQKQSSSSRSHGGQMQSNGSGTSAPQKKSTALQSKYAQYKSKGSKGYKSRTSKNKYGQKMY